MGAPDDSKILVATGGVARARGMDRRRWGAHPRGILARWTLGSTRELSRSAATRCSREACGRCDRNPTARPAGDAASCRADDATARDTRRAGGTTTRCAPACGRSSTDPGPDPARAAPCRDAPGVLSGAGHDATETARRGAGRATSENEPPGDWDAAPRALESRAAGGSRQRAGPGAAEPTRPRTARAALCSAGARTSPALRTVTTAPGGTRRHASATRYDRAASGGPRESSDTPAGPDR